MNNVVSPARFGRVTRASIDRLTAECFTPADAPPLGQLVAVEDIPDPIYGVVSAVYTEGIDPTRRVNARGEPEHNLERVLADNPHVPALLSTVFEAVLVGHKDGGSVRQYLAAAPAPILARVRACTAAEGAYFAERYDFLRLLLNAGPLSDDVIAATLRNAAAGRSDGRAVLVRGGKALTTLLADDATRLHAILRRLQP